jgi:hypothetical protein
MLRTRDTIPRSVHPVSVNNLCSTARGLLSISDGPTKLFVCNKNKIFPKFTSNQTAMFFTQSALNSPWREWRTVFTNNVTFRHLWTEVRNKERKPAVTGEASSRIYYLKTYRKLKHYNFNVWLLLTTFRYTYTNIQQDATIMSWFYYKISTCFRYLLYPSSAVQYCSWQSLV